jgi:hypothetical protein
MKSEIFHFGNLYLIRCHKTFIANVTGTGSTMMIIPMMRILTDDIFSQIIAEPSCEQNSKTKNMAVITSIRAVSRFIIYLISCTLR